MSTTILRVDASMRREGSITRTLTDAVIAKLNRNGDHTVLTRDLADGMPFFTEPWIAANFTDASERTSEQRAVLAQSDALVAELQEADTVVIGVPIYNFGVPAALKAWIDMITRARLTFRYTETGPEGLLKNKKAILVVASGGTQVGSEIDFAVPYMKLILAFVGITDVEVIHADEADTKGKSRIENAEAEITRLAA